MKGQAKKPHFHVTAGLIWKNGKVLIAKRAKGSHFEGFWEFPGGKQEKGESMKACLEREIREELGFRVKANQLLLTVNYEYGSKVISLHAFDCAYVEGEPKGLESQEIRWVPFAGLQKFAFPPPDRKVIEFLVRSGRGKEKE